MIKVILANDNDILYNSLSNVSLQNELNIEIIKVSKDKLLNLICQIKEKDKLIILDKTTSITFVQNVLKNANEKIGNNTTNIIILVIDSNSISNIQYQNSHYSFQNELSNTSILDIVTLISSSLKNCIELEKSIDDTFWQLGFTSYFKGSIYLKDAILIAHNERKLLLDTQALVKKVAKKHNIANEKVVRSNMDRALGNMLKYIDKNKLYNIFGKDYDGREISLKYFIDLFIRYLEKQRYCCLEH